MHNNGGSFFSFDLFSVIEPMLEEGNQAVINVSGMSMWPFICHNRDQVVLEKCDETRLKKGDVILFRPIPEKYILHRITTLEKDYFETTGDGNCFRDGRFRYGCIRAKAVRFIRKGKTIDCESPLWKAVFALWCALYPIRPFLLRTLRRIGRLKSKLR